MRAFPYMVRFGHRFHTIQSIADVVLFKCACIEFIVYIECKMESEKKNKEQLTLVCDDVNQMHDGKKRNCK